MSKDNWTAIIKVRNKFIGYDCSASISFSTLKSIREGCHKVFTVNSLEEAISQAQKQDTEYGYTFVNLRKGKKQK